MQVALFEPSHRDDLFPFTLTRPVSSLRKGIMTIRASWERIIGEALRINTEADMPPTFGAAAASATPSAAASATPLGAAREPTLFLNAALLPDPAVWQEIAQLGRGESFFHDNIPLAYYEGDIPQAHFKGEDKVVKKELATPFRLLRYPWELVQWNDHSLRIDFDLLTAGRISQPIPDGNQVVNPEAIFLEEGAKVSFSVLNASTGPIYIGRNAEVMDGCLLRGPIALGEGATLKMGAKVYGATTLGPYCAAGGEVKNVIMTGYSNKNHDGYLGDSLIGEWCNLGGGTSCSNVKNNATPVRVWNPGRGRAEVAGLKAGLFMGDYSRSAIQSAFNTGTVVGVCCSVHGGAVCSGYVPDFSWGLRGERYDWDKALRDIDNWKKLKGQRLTPDEIQILRPIFARI